MAEEIRPSPASQIEGYLAADKNIVGSREQGAVRLTYHCIGFDRIVESGLISAGRVAERFR